MFEDIKIVGLNDASSGPSGEGALMKMVLDLSTKAPDKWCQLFNTAWNQHIYMMKRRASAFGSAITVTCMPNELQGQINEMKGIISRVNSSYKQLQDEALKKNEALKAQAEQERNMLSDLKGKLDFD